MAVATQTPTLAKLRRNVMELYISDQPLDCLTCAANGVLLLTSRISVEMVQKAAAFGAEILVAVSAPTALAIYTAEQAGMTLIGVARRDGFEVFTRPDRIRTARRPHAGSGDGARFHRGVVRVRGPFALTKEN